MIITLFSSLVINPLREGRTVTDFSMIAFIVFCYWLLSLCPGKPSLLFPPELSVTVLRGMTVRGIVTSSTFPSRAKPMAACSLRVVAHPIALVSVRAAAVFTGSAPVTLLRDYCKVARTCSLPFRGVLLRGVASPVNVFRAL